MTSTLRGEVEALIADWIESATARDTLRGFSDDDAVMLRRCARQLQSSLDRHPPSTGDGVVVPTDGCYIQDSRSYVGNCMLFWGPNRSGYTTDIDEAGVYTLEEATRQHRERETDIQWSVAYIRSKAKSRVDFQYVAQADAVLAGEKE